ncbi:Serine/threonine kinase [Richelia intracellularis HH01]|uniref:Serine/threonine kinase n=1 Tax=Richelia intracellularis HH01 TaxID=1165094 RepID=M1X2L5_9NOST|nr:SUMF1/EgtB/PvdO family nonheme iron enzyme [Richelia intracellularis]CCH67035.1 Serine/threonine kinase [Richelia intracellularis HH01]
MSLVEEFKACRHKTLQIFKDIDRETLCYQADPNFSPVGWHLGHIAYIESLWLLESSGGLPCLFPHYRQLFAADSLPKSQRCNLPDLGEIYNYLEVVRKQVFQYLETVNLKSDIKLCYFIIQHESQHYETICSVLEIIKQQKNYQPQLTSGNYSSLNNELVEIAASKFLMGNNSTYAMDNESPTITIHLDTYWIDKYPVTCSQYRKFIEFGGYNNPKYWSKSGWQWRQKINIQQPLYWQNNIALNNHPVSGVSYYEAQAYACFIGKRLPTEAEWEKAASWNIENNSCQIYLWGDQENTRYYNYNNHIGTTTVVDSYPLGQSAYGLFDTLGNVWEWTDSWFCSYKGFKYHPSKEYSQVYFNNQYHVLKGGSWASTHWILRPSFRNWYHPETRQVRIGFRCAVS